MKAKHICNRLHKKAGADRAQYAGNTEAKHVIALFRVLLGAVEPCPLGVPVGHGVVKAKHNCNHLHGKLGLTEHNARPTPGEYRSHAVCERRKKQSER